MNQEGSLTPNEKADEIQRGHKGIKIKDVIRYSQMGLSCREIGKLLNCTKQSVSYLLVKWENGQAGNKDTQRMSDMEGLKEQRKSRFTFPYRKASPCKDGGLRIKDKVEAIPPTPPKNTGFVIIRR